MQRFKRIVFSFLRWEYFTMMLRARLLRSAPVVLMALCISGQPQPSWATPLPVTGLELRYEAGQQTYQSIASGDVAPLTAVGAVAGEGNPVNGWLNLAAGNLTPPMQTGADSRRPIRQTVDGTSVLRFDGSNDNLLAVNLPGFWQAGGITSLDDGTYSWVVGFRTSVANQADRSVMLLNNDIFRVSLNGGNIHVTLDPDGAGAGGPSALSTPEIIDDWVTVIFVRNGDSAEAFVNGTSIGTLTDLMGVADFDTVRLGASVSNGTTGFNGDIFIALAYGSALGSDEVLGVQSYIDTMIIPEPNSLYLAGLTLLGTAAVMYRRRCGA